MAKKAGEKLVKSISKKAKPSKAKTSTAKPKRENINKNLIENFISLQKVMTNLAFKFDNLSDQISKLLQLFEISAKSFVEKADEKEKTGLEKDKEFLQRLDTLLDQNKTIAKGLTLMEEKLRQRMHPAPTHTAPPTQMQPRAYPPVPIPRYPGEEKKFKPRPLPRI